MITFTEVTENTSLDVDLEPDVELQAKQLQCLGLTFTAERLPSAQVALTISDDSGELAEELAFASDPRSLALAATDLVMGFEQGNAI